MNQPSYSHVRDHGLIAKAADGTLSWLRDIESSSPITRTCPNDSSKDTRTVDDASDEDASASDEDASISNDFSDDTRVLRNAFMAWRVSEDSECLLVTGLPGQGKSVLTISVLEHLETGRTTSRILDRCKVIYHFCSINIENKFHNATFVLRMLIVQLCNDRRLFAQLPSKLQQNGNELSSVPLGELQDIFSDLVKASPYQCLYCVIDGLDVYVTGMQKLVSFLKRLFESRKSSAGTCLKIFCTSRPEQPILDIWDRLPHAVLRSDHKDLNTFIQSSVDSLPERFDDRMRRQLSISLQNRAG